MNEANRLVIHHMIQTIENFIEYAKTDRALFTGKTIEHFEVSVRQLRQILEANSGTQGGNPCDG